MILPDEILYAVPRAYELATGSRVDPSTAHRHRLRGVHGVKLATLKVGGRRKTSVEAVRRFIDATTAAADGMVAPQSPSKRSAAVDRAERELERRGI